LLSIDYIRRSTAADFRGERTAAESGGGRLKWR
jgi:hypothetical protein